MEGSADYLSGKLLVAMPGMQDPRFSHSLVYLCAHSDDGAMGLIVNKRAESLTLTDLFGKIGIPVGDVLGREPVHYGGPVETGRGFVLHSADYHLSEATVKVSPHVGLTATVDILRALVGGHGPRHSLLALGYAGWGSGQLEAELRHNGWLHCPADQDLLFNVRLSDKWNAAMARIGIDPALLSGQVGSA